MSRCTKRTEEGWCLGPARFDDGYVGWIPERTRSRRQAYANRPTSVCRRCSTLAFPGASISRLPPIEALPMGTHVSPVLREDRATVRASPAHGWHLSRRQHLAPLDAAWRRIIVGGRGAFRGHAVSVGRQVQSRDRLLRAGADGAVSLRAPACPRDSDMQEDSGSVSRSALLGALNRCICSAETCSFGSGHAAHGPRSQRPSFTPMHITCRPSRSRTLDQAAIARIREAAGSDVTSAIKAGDYLALSIRRDAFSSSKLQPLPSESADLSRSPL
jgi:hypothetical protein